jgi:hypothetical protein
MALASHRATPGLHQLEETPNRQLPLTKYYSDYRQGVYLHTGDFEGDTVCDPAESIVSHGNHTRGLAVSRADSEIPGQREGVPLESYTETCLECS